MGDAVFVDVPSDGFRFLQRAGQHDGLSLGIFHRLAGDGVPLALRTPFFSFFEGDGVGTAGGGGVEVEIDGDEEVARAYHGTPCAGDAFVHGTAAEVGLLARHGEFLGDAFVFTGTADGEVAALFGIGGCFVAVARDEQFVGDALCQLTGELRTFLQGDAAYGDEGQHVGGADAGMGTMVLAHVYQLSGAFHCLEGGFHHWGGFTHKGDDGAVGGFSGVDIEEAYSLGAFYFSGYLLDDFRVAPFAEVGHTLHDLFFHV